jgi:hypothetical protein
VLLQLAPVPEDVGLRVIEVAAYGVEQARGHRLDPALKPASPLELGAEPRGLEQLVEGPDEIHRLARWLRAKPWVFYPAAPDPIRCSP